MIIIGIAINIATNAANAIGFGKMDRVVCQGKCNCANIIKTEKIAAKILKP